jgi:hypothetical protein
MKKFTLKKKMIAGAAVAALALGVGGTAFAYWTSTGSGSGSAATTAGSSDLTYSQNTLTAMYPGDSSQALTVTVTNNSLTQNEHVGGVAAYITTDQAGCTGADFLLDGVAAPSTLATAHALSFTATDLAPGTTADATGTIQFNNTAGNQDVCKSAAVTLNYSS